MTKKDKQPRQLRMIWKNDGKAAVYPVLPPEMEIKAFDEVENAVDKWLDAVVGITVTKQEPKYFEECVVNHGHYDPKRLFFITYKGDAAATVTLLLDYETKDCEVHMVGCRADMRGKGIGTALNALTEYVMKSEGMETAWLTTDEFRVPAIKGYLKIGFKPDIDDDEMQRRWDGVFADLEKGTPAPVLP